MHSKDCDYCNRILDILSKNSLLWCSAIAKHVESNSSTVQRHLSALIEKGLVKENIYAGIKFYGRTKSYLTRSKSKNDQG